MLKDYYIFLFKLYKVVLEAFLKIFILNSVSQDYYFFLPPTSSRLCLLETNTCHLTDFAKSRSLSILDFGAGAFNIGLNFANLQHRVNLMVHINRNTIVQILITIFLNCMFLGGLACQ